MGQEVKVKRDTIAVCMTCPICNKLLKEATTISLCLHTFCRKCIYEKLSDEEMDCCPVCNIDLGCIPVDKLRPDHNLEDIRGKIFPLKRRKIEVPEPEVPPSVSPPVKRKERSLSSLVVNTPKVLGQSGLTGRRTKSSVKKAAALRSSNSAFDESIKKDKDSVDDRAESSSSPETLNKIASKRQNSSTPEPSSNDKISARDGENEAENWAGKDMWTPLNCLLEAATRSKPYKFNSPGASLAKSDTNDTENEVFKTRSKAKSEILDESDVKENGYKMETKNDKNGTSVHPGVMKRKRLHAMGQKKDAASGEPSISPQDILDAAGPQHNRRNGQIWFSLLASEDQHGDCPLPQISSRYLRIKDGNLPVSCIQKYLVKKLDLTRESEVRIMCRGEPVPPTLLLYELLDLWLPTEATPKRVPATIGSSAKDFVMVLTYTRRVGT